MPRNSTRAGADFAARLRSRWKKFVLVVVALACVIGYAIGIGTLIQNRANESIVEDASMERSSVYTNAEDGINIYFQITNIDPIREYATIEYEPAPKGIYGNTSDDSFYPLRPFTFQYNSNGIGREPSTSALSEVTYQPNVWSAGFEAPTNLFPCTSIEEETIGDPSSKAYPNDGYCGHIIVNMFERDPLSQNGSATYPMTWSEQYGSGIDGYRITFKRVPFNWDLATGACNKTAQENGWSCSIEDDIATGFSRVEFYIQRADVVKAFAFVVLGMMMLSALCALAMTIAVISKSRPPALEGLAFLAALLFAVQPLRGAMPDSPPIGTDIDVLLFYPCILAILASLAIQVVIWIRRADFRA